jgi:hypothetical protein
MKVTIDEGMGEEKSLCLITGFKPLHVSFASPCWPVRILSPVIEVTALTVLDLRKQLPSSDTVTSELIRHDHSRFVFQAGEQASEETLRRLTITATLNQNVEHYTVLVHGTPEIMQYAVDPDEDLASRPGEFHPQALPEPCVNLSIHTAPDVRPPTKASNGLALPTKLLPSPVGLGPRLNNAAPSVQSHYRTFNPTTGCSAPVPRIGTLALSVSANWASPLTSGRQVLTFHTRA